MGTKKGLVIAYDIIGPLMAGPGLRSLRLAESVAKRVPIDILLGDGSVPLDNSPAGFINAPVKGREKEFISGYSACLASSTFPLTHPWLLNADIPLIVDCYDPYVLENLFMYSANPPAEARFQHERHLKAQVEALLRADRILVASERQRDLFTGALMALNRLNPAVTSGIGEDKLISIVPFGIEESDPPARGTLRGKTPGYGDDDEILIWGGGIWEWFDPINLIKAVDILKSTHPNIRLHFLGVRHPNRHIPFPAKAKEAMELAAKLKLKDKHIFFGDWAPASERGKYLSDADIGVSFHRTGFETRYSFRTRLMDYLWAELPMVLSAGDDLGAMFADAGLATALEDANPEPIAEAVDHWLKIIREERDDLSLKFNTMKSAYRWSHVAEPVTRFFENPYSTIGMRGEGFFTGLMGEMEVSGKPSGFKDIVKKALRRD